MAEVGTAGGDELDRFLERHPEIGHVDAVLVDLCGIVRGKRYPRADVHKLFEGGFALPYSVHLLDDGRVGVFFYPVFNRFHAIGVEVARRFPVATPVAEFVDATHQ